MKLFSTFNQFFLFLVLIVGQHILAVPLTKWEAHKAMILNDHLRGVAFRLQSEPFKSEISRKSAELAINELERLGQKDPDSSFAKDAQKWREAIGKLESLLRTQGIEGLVKEPQVSVEEIAIAKKDVERVLENITNPEPVKKFSIEKQKESIAINEKNTLQAVEAELKLLAQNKQALSNRAEAIKKEYEKAIIEYKQKNQQVLKKQFGFAIDVSKEVKSFNKSIDTIVKNIIKEQRELKKQAPSGLSLEDKLEEFNEFIADQIKLGRKRSYVGTVALAKDEKDKVDEQLFMKIEDIVVSLRGQTGEKIRQVLKEIKDKSMKMIDAQFDKPGPLVAWLLSNNDKDREDIVNKKLDEMFTSLLVPAQPSINAEENVVEQKEAGVEPIVEQKEIELPPLSSVPPKRPAKLDNVSIIQPPQPIKKEELQQVSVQLVQQNLEGQPKEPQKELSKKEQFEQMKNEFSEFIKKMIKETEEANVGTSSISGDQQDEYDSRAIDKAKSMVRFLVLHPNIEDYDTAVKWISDAYQEAIHNQTKVNSNYERLHGDNSEERKTNFIKNLNDAIDSIKKKHEATE